jgi:prepilin-type N-terminal cleavage/methylation domain-containing protein
VSRGFTLFEALVAVVLLGVGIAGSVGALSSLGRAQIAANESERMSELARRKYDELSVSDQVQAASLSGDFADWNENRYVWEASVTPTGVENLESLTVVVTRRGDEDGREARAEGLLFFAPPEGGTAQ